MAPVEKGIEEISRKSDEKLDCKVIILRYRCVDCRKEKERVEEDIYRKITRLPGPVTKQSLQFYYVERKNLAEGGEGVEKHLLDQYKAPDKSLNGILMGAFSRLKVTENAEMCVELRFNHLNDYVMDCERRGRKKQCTEFLKKLDLYEAKRCLERSKTLFENIQQYFDIEYSKKKWDPEEYHPYECNCKDCEETSLLMNEMEAAEAAENALIRPCDLETDRKRVEERVHNIKDERAERLALRRANDARQTEEVAERNRGRFRSKPPPKVKKRAI